MDNEQFEPLTLGSLLDRLQEMGYSDSGDLILTTPDGLPFVDVYVEDGQIFLSDLPFID